MTVARSKILKAFHIRPPGWGPGDNIPECLRRLVKVRRAGGSMILWQEHSDAGDDTQDGRHG